jgi:6-pyruvoyl-tetrahydropterin synthase
MDFPELNYRLSFKYRFEAAHRFTKSCADSCATPHGHTWFAEAHFGAPETCLTHEDMLLEFSQLKGAWKTFIQQTVDHSFLHHYEDPILPALLKFIPKFRGLPFPGDPTTEMVAALFYSKLCSMHKEMNKELAEGVLIKPMAVYIQETPTNSMTFRPPLTGTSKLLEQIDSKFEGWWQTPEPSDRRLTVRN